MRVIDDAESPERVQNDWFSQGMGVAHSSSPESDPEKDAASVFIVGYLHEVELISVLPDPVVVGTRPSAFVKFVGGKTNCVDRNLRQVRNLRSSGYEKTDDIACMRPVCGDKNDVSKMFYFCFIFCRFTKMKMMLHGCSGLMLVAKPGELSI